MSAILPNADEKSSSANFFWFESGSWARVLQCNVLWKSSSDAKDAATWRYGLRKGDDKVCIWNLSRNDLTWMIFNPKCYENIPKMSQNPRFCMMVTLWKLSKKWGKINDFSWWWSYENCRKMRKKQYLFIGATLWKLSKNELKSMIVHMGYLMKIVEKWAKINSIWQ